MRTRLFHIDYYRLCTLHYLLVYPVGEMQEEILNAEQACRRLAYRL